MRGESLLCHVKRAYRPAPADSKHRLNVYPNLTHELQLTALNQLWVADITYVRVGFGFVYVAVVLDRFSRKAIGWAISREINTHLTLEALNMAIGNRDIKLGCIHHSDRGAQYASQAYIQRLEIAGMKISMSRKGSPYDNGAAESFMKTLKYEEVYLNEYKTIADIQNGIPYFLESIYNKRRLHSSLEYNSPDEFENKWATQPSFRKKLNKQSFGAHNLIP